MLVLQREEIAVYKVQLKKFTNKREVLQVLGRSYLQIDVRGTSVLRIKPGECAVMSDATYAAVEGQLNKYRSALHITYWSAAGTAAVPPAEPAVDPIVEVAEPTAEELPPEQVDDAAPVVDDAPASEPEDAGAAELDEADDAADTATADDAPQAKRRGRRGRRAD